jgi:hypothetical protein
MIGSLSIDGSNRVYILLAKHMLSAKSTWQIGGDPPAANSTANGTLLSRVSAVFSADSHMLLQNIGGCS